jgi:hypothetical protein
MTKRFQVGDLVISHTKTLARAMVGRPALVIDTSITIPGHQHLRLKVGEVEWWDHSKDCEKVSE